MVAVDTSVVWIGVRRPSWFVFALFAFFVEQLAVNGPQLESVLLLTAVLLAGWEKWFLNVERLASGGNQSD